MPHPQNTEKTGTPVPALAASIALVILSCIASAAARPFEQPFETQRSSSSSKEDGMILMPTDAPNGWRTTSSETGTRWAILIAGSAGYGNYRHQADVCHAYQVLKRGGLEDDNIIVFMYDDIADNEYNPRPGIIINSPTGDDVYAGVPKDYTGSNVTVDNFFAVLLGNRSALTGGSGKVVDSGPNDHIFIFYSDHGGPGVLGMPTNPNLYASDFIEALQMKHDAGGYREMVIYIEACESGSIFEGLLPDDLNIYVTTAANAEESSWGTYCPGMDPSPPEEYFTCLGDLYSVAWMEDSEVNNLDEETLKDQYITVKARTSNHDTYVSGSHVMQYGDHNISDEGISIYMGSDPSKSASPVESGLFGLSGNQPVGLQYFLQGKRMAGVQQRDADLVFLWHKFKIAREGSKEKAEAQEELIQEMSYRMHLDKSVDFIGKTLFGHDQVPTALHGSRSFGKPLVNDWACLKSLVRIFESYCGSLTEYGLKHMRAFANVCNAGVHADTFAKASLEVCAGSKLSLTVNPQEVGFSA